MKALKTIIQNDIDADLNNIRRHNLIKDFLTLHQGKEYNKRLWNKLPEGMQYDPRARMHHIRIEGKSHLLGYFGDDNECNPARLENTDVCHGTAAQNRINKNQAILDDPAQFKRLNAFYSKLKKAAKIINEINIADSDSFFEFGSFLLPCHYDIMRGAGLNPSAMSEILYTPNK